MRNIMDSQKFGVSSHKMFQKFYQEKLNAENKAAARVYEKSSLLN